MPKFSDIAYNYKTAIDNLSRYYARAAECQAEVDRIGAIIVKALKQIGKLVAAGDYFFEIVGGKLRAVEAGAGWDTWIPLEEPEEK